MIFTCLNLEERINAEIEHATQEVIINMDFYEKYKSDRCYSELSNSWFRLKTAYWIRDGRFNAEVIK